MIFLASQYTTDKKAEERDWFVEAVVGDVTLPQCQSSGNFDACVAYCSLLLSMKAKVRLRVEGRRVIQSIKEI